MKYQAGWDKSVKSPVFKRERPPMPPLAVRVQVALGQLNKAGNFVAAAAIDLAPLSSAKKLEAALLALGIKEPQCDHDPALVLRKYNPRIKDVAARYTPHAHDPDALVYREKADHQQKTTGRKPGAERTITTKGSDIGLKSKFARLEGRVKPKRKVPIKSRGFAKGPKRKISSRGFR